MGFCCCKVCRKWNVLGSDNNLWFNLFRERWGEDLAMFYAPDDSKSWKDVYEVQDHGDRVGLGLKIIREGGDYYLVHQGEIQSYLGSRRQRKGTSSCTLDTQREFSGEGSQEEGSWTKFYSSLGIWRLPLRMQNVARCYKCISRHQ
ncbi:f-box/wd repeat-containing protein pof10 [Fagus crenata]